MKTLLFSAFLIASIFIFGSCLDKNPFDSDDAPALDEIVWSDYNANPILTKLQNGTYYGLYYGRVLYDEGKFKMWFANSYGSDRYDVGYAESSDGFFWHIVKNSALTVGGTGSWDSYSVHPGAVIKDGSVYKMYYCGQACPNDASDKRIGLATSTDGINWTRCGEDVVKKIDIWGYTTDIVKYKDTYYLYYGNTETVGVATSSDGINFSKTNLNIIMATAPWEGSRIWSCSVIRDTDNKFKMIYTSGRFNAFGYAESEDGLKWKKKQFPIFDYLGTNEMLDNMRYPFFRKVKKTYYLYYSTMSPSFEYKMRAAKAEYK